MNNNRLDNIRKGAAIAATVWFTLALLGVVAGIPALLLAPGTLVFLVLTAAGLVRAERARAPTPAYGGYKMGDRAEPTPSVIKPRDEFDPFCTCPACRMLASHLLHPEPDHPLVQRTCVFCEHVWYTNATPPVSTEPAEPVEPACPMCGQSATATELLYWPPRGDGRPTDRQSLRFACPSGHLWWRVLDVGEQPVDTPVVRGDPPQRQVPPTMRRPTGKPRYR